MKRDYMTLSEVIRVYRTQKRLSLEDVAQAAGVSKAHVWDMERGESSNPSIRTVKGLSRALGVSFRSMCQCALKSLPEP